MDKSIAKASLPQAVNAVGDRIGLNYRIDKKQATRKYIDDHQESSRLDFDQLKNSYYSLNESRTKKDNENQIKTKKIRAKNPLKLNSEVRKLLYKLSSQEKSRIKYSTFEKVHELWQQYSSQVLRESSDPMTVFRMDLHGAYLKCTASRNPTLIGCEGIVVQETRNTFIIVKRTNRLVTLPKRDSLFEFRVDQNVCTIHGCNLLFTTQARTKVKYKRSKYTSDV